MTAHTAFEIKTPEILEFALAVFPNAQQYQNPDSLIGSFIVLNYPFTGMHSVIRPENFPSDTVIDNTDIKIVLKTIS